MTSGGNAARHEPASCVSVTTAAAPKRCGRVSHREALLELGSHAVVGGQLWLQHVLQTAAGLHPWRGRPWISDLGGDKDTITCEIPTAEPLSEHGADVGLCAVALCRVNGRVAQIQRTAHNVCCDCTLAASAVALHVGLAYACAESHSWHSYAVGERNESICTVVAGVTGCRDGRWCLAAGGPRRRRPGHMAGDT
jgi:hypothetical protein